MFTFFLLSFICISLLTFYFFKEICFITLFLDGHKSGIINKYNKYLWLGVCVCTPVHEQKSNQVLVYACVHMTMHVGSYAYVFLFMPLILIYWLYGWILLSYIFLHLPAFASELSKARTLYSMPGWKAIWSHVLTVPVFCITTSRDIISMDRCWPHAYDTFFFGSSIYIISFCTCDETVKKIELNIIPSI